MKTIPQYETTLPRICAALLTGVVTGGVYFWFLNIALGGSVPSVELSVRIISAVSLFWLIGLIGIFSPIWFVFHKAKIRNPYIFVMLGIATPPVYLFITDFLNIGVPPLGWHAYVLGLPVGWVVWRIAYRRGEVL